MRRFFPLMFAKAFWILQQNQRYLNSLILMNILTTTERTADKSFQISVNSKRNAHEANLSLSDSTVGSSQPAPLACFLSTVVWRTELHNK